MDQETIRTKKAELTNQMDTYMRMIQVSEDNNQKIDLMDKIQQAKIEYNKIVEIERNQYIENAPKEFTEEKSEKHM